MLITNSLYLYITYNDAFPLFSYRALYNYKLQNEDELELKEGDVVMVMRSVMTVGRRNIASDVALWNLPWQLRGENGLNVLLC